MKTITIWFVISIVSVGYAEARSRHFQPFTSQDKAYQGIYTILQVMDWNQTRNGVIEEGRKELNPFYGNYPSRTRVDSIMGFGLAAHWLITWYLPPKQRKWFQLITIIAEYTVVRHNYRLGLSMGF